MGEARRRKQAGHTAPDPKWKRTKKMTRKQIDELMPNSMAEMMALMMAARSYGKLPKLPREEGDTHE